MKPEEFIKRKIGEESMNLFPTKFSKEEIYEYMTEYATEHHENQVKNNVVLDTVIKCTCIAFHKSDDCWDNGCKKYRK
jgi:hypothetical protein